MVMKNKNLLKLKNIIKSDIITPYINTNNDVLEEKTVHHGSPNDFDNFSIQHIGEGEGSQVYGWGLYFTDLVEVANFYRKKLTDTIRGTLIFDNKEYKIDYEFNKGKIFDKSIKNNSPERFAIQAFLDNNGIKKEAIKYLENIDKKHPNDKFMEAINIIKNNRIRYKDEPNTNYGKIYTVNIPEDNELALFDVVLSKQNELTQKVILILAKEYNINLNNNNRFIINNIPYTWLKKESLWINEKTGENIDGGIYNTILEKLKEAKGNKDYAIFLTKKTMNSFMDDSDFKEIQAELKSLGLEYSYEDYLKDNENDDNIRYLSEVIDTFKNLDIQESSYYNKNDLIYGELTFDNFYNLLSNNLHSDKKTSLALLKYGIKGHKFLDQDSRDKGEGTYNYVIWDDTAIEILEKS